MFFQLPTIKINFQGQKIQYSGILPKQKKQFSLYLLNY